MYKFILFLMVALVACSDNTQGQTKIDAAKTASLLKENKSIQLIDLRTPAELLQTGKIEGAKNINFNSPDFQTLIGQLDKNQPVIIYCAAGSRSGAAALQMEKMGFTKIYDFTGGMNDWKSKGNKTVQQ
jgi:phage shock protein E